MIANVYPTKEGKFRIEFVDDGKRLDAYEVDDIFFSKKDLNKDFLPIQHKKVKAGSFIH